MKVYKIANLTLGLTNGNVEGLKFQKELEDFYMYDAKNDASEVDVFMECRFLWDDILPEKLILSTPLLSVYEQKDSFYVIYEYHELVYAYLIYKNSNRTIIYINQYFYEGNETYDVTLEKRKGIPEEDIKYSGGELLLYTIRDAFFFHAMKYGRIAIHSSSLVYRDRVWLFSAATGVGKTTHIAMWEKAGITFEVFNGDVVMCYENDGQIYAAGLPWSGTSGQYMNKDILLGGIFFLNRGEENSAAPISSAPAALSFMSRCLSPNWTDELKKKNMKLIGTIVTFVNCMQLKCTPTKDAALCAMRFVDEIFIVD